MKVVDAAQDLVEVVQGLVHGQGAGAVFLVLQHLRQVAIYGITTGTGVMSSNGFG